MLLQGRMGRSLPQSWQFCKQNFAEIWLRVGLFLGWISALQSDSEKGMGGRDIKTESEKGLPAGFGMNGST